MFNGVGLVEQIVNFTPPFHAFHLKQRFASFGYRKISAIIISLLANVDVDTPYLVQTKYIIEHLTFNQGVTGSRPVRPTKLNRPSLPGEFRKNQGVKSLGQPTP